MRQYDSIIIGAGPGGYELAAMLAASGESVAVVERSHPGGTCLNCGCIPTKCLAATADTFRTCRDAGLFGVDCAAPSVDYPQAVARMRRVVEQLREGVMAALRDVTYIEGEARLRPGMEVQVGADGLIQARRRIVIATGSAPASLRVPGAGTALDSTAALSLEKLPESAVIVGGGVIGMELASIWNTLGSRVTVVEYCKEILPGIDPEIAKRLRTTLTRAGLEILTGAEVTAIARGAVTCDTRRGPQTLTADIVVSAVGRRPVVPEGCDECGIKLTPRGFVAVDSSMATTAPGIYAIGDVNGLSMLAHSAVAQARVIASGDTSAFNPAAVPAVVFTHPELAQVGIVPEGVETVTVKRTFASVGKAVAMEEAAGVAKFTCRKSDGAILAVTILGPHAADLIAEATMLVTDAVPLGRVATGYIHAHPTLSEIFT